MYFSSQSLFLSVYSLSPLWFSFCWLIEYFSALDTDDEEAQQEIIQSLRNCVGNFYRFKKINASCLEIISLSSSLAARGPFREKSRQKITGPWPWLNHIGFVSRGCNFNCFVQSQNHSYFPSLFQLWGGKQCGYSKSGKRRYCLLFYLVFEITSGC